MKIAAFVNHQGNSAYFHETGDVCLYEQIKGTWQQTKKIALEINGKMSLAEIRNAFFTTMDQLEGCRVFIVREFRGLFHALLLEELGYHTWKSEGALLEQLDHVAQKEREYVAELAQKSATEPAQPSGHCGCGSGCSSRRMSATPVSGCGATPPQQPSEQLPQPTRIGPIEQRLYRLDLGTVLQQHPELNSWQILHPVLEKKHFNLLEIRCDHVPKWFAHELQQLHLTATETLVGTETRVVVSHA
nr:Fe-only nitrogenase accessory protein AnfO [uncultured Desulfuromonas sp.]